MMQSDISCYGRKVKFYLNGAHAGEPEEGFIHGWFLCDGDVQLPCALIERSDGSLIFTSYRHVIFVNPLSDYDLEKLLEKGLLE